jgi:drug/metabolite transporter (DMT)-like permease
VLVLGSSLTWSIGSFVLRYRRLRGNHLSVAAYQMLVGGGTLLLIGLFLGESQELARERFTPQAVYAFFHLLIFGSLIGFVAYNWLLGHVSAALAGTYAYVNPLVAIVVGRLLNHEPITGWILSGMVVILAGVALVRGGGVRCHGRGREVSEQQAALAHRKKPVTTLLDSVVARVEVHQEHDLVIRQDILTNTDGVSRQVP